MRNHLRVSSSCIHKYLIIEIFDNSHKFSEWSLFSHYMQIAELSGLSIHRLTTRV